MRKKEIIISIICFTVGFVISFLLINTGKQYSREAYVKVTTEEKVVLDDTWGHEWTWVIEEKEKEEIKALKKGEKVILTFDTKGTYDFVDDDVLIKIKKN